MTKVKENVVALAILKSNNVLTPTSAHGSQLSLMSGGSSMYGSTTEEQRQANEVRRLKRELTEAREQVMSLSSQLSTNVSTANFFANSCDVNNNTPVIDFPLELFCCHVFIEIKLTAACSLILNANTIVDCFEIKSSRTF